MFFSFPSSLLHTPPLLTFFLSTFLCLYLSVSLSLSVCLRPSASLYSILQFLCLFVLVSLSRIFPLRLHLVVLFIASLSFFYLFLFLFSASYYYSMLLQHFFALLRCSPVCYHAQTASTGPILFPTLSGCLLFPLPLLLFSFFLLFLASPPSPPPPPQPPPSPFPHI